jgi:hypothetical protein
MPKSKLVFTSPKSSSIDAETRIPREEMAFTTPSQGKEKVL